MIPFRRPASASGSARPVTPDAVPVRRGDHLFPNGAIVAKREYLQRVRSRTFVLATMVLMALAVGAALVPVLTRLLDQQLTSRVAVYASDASLSFDPVPIIAASLNGAGAGTAASPRPVASASPGASPSPRAWRSWLRQTRLSRPPMVGTSRRH